MPGRRPSTAHARPVQLPGGERRHNLPAELTSFVGREAELAEAARLLAGTRLLTLAGAPGVGKTRLALRVARDNLGAFRDGVWWVELAALADPALVPRAVARALDVREPPGRPLQDTLAGALRSRRLLLLLDNCEHLIEACAALADALLRACPDVRVLATSREPMGIAGETAWRVPSLSLPAADRSQPAAVDPPPALLAYAAIRLFVERAKSALPEFVLTDRNAPAVAQICRRLDGIPLAIELAAARVRALTPEQIAARLDDRFRLLTGGSRTALPRHRTLRSLVDWSHDLLPSAEQALLRRLSVFAGSWSLEAAEAVCAFAADAVSRPTTPDSRFLSPGEILDLQQQLVDKSLVLAAEQDGETRYSLLETVRQYAADRLHLAGEEVLLRDRHLDWFTRFAEQAESAFWGPRQGAACDRLESELDNFRAALEWGGSASADREQVNAALRLAGSLWRFWDIRAHFGEGRAWLDAALARSRTRSKVRVKALIASAYMRFVAGEYTAAGPYLEQALALARELNYSFGAALALAALGGVEQAQGNLDRAEALFEESLAASRRTGERRGVYLALHWLALAVAMPRGELGRADALLKESLELAREQGDTWTIAYLMFNLGAVQLLQGNSRVAREAILESLALRRELNDTWSMVYCLQALGWINGAEGRSEQAALLLGAGQALLDGMGVTPWPLIQPFHERAVAAAREALGEHAFADSWAAGRAMDLEEALRFALQPSPAIVTTGAVSSARDPGPLTRRECEVAALIARGLTNRQIAHELVITEQTADTHVRNILHKLGVHSRAQVASWATEQNLLGRDTS